MFVGNVNSYLYIAWVMLFPEYMAMVRVVMKYLAVGMAEAHLSQKGP